MEFSIQREKLLKPLKSVIPALEQRQTLQILSYVLIRIKNQRLNITATDSEIELSSDTALDSPITLEATLPGRKLMDICRALPENAVLHIELKNNQAIIRSNNSRFVLTTLPPHTFPNITIANQHNTLTLGQKDLRFLIARSQFAMAQQDVRYFLNGMLLEVNEGAIRTVATDGHRLAINSMGAPVINNTFIQAIIPRKSIIELNRLLDDSDTDLFITVSSNHIQIKTDHFTFISNLIDGRYPEYKKIIPKDGNKIIRLDCNQLKQTLTRVAILTNETFRGVRFQLKKGCARILTNNPEQEIAEEQITLDYDGEDIEIAFNIAYLIDVLTTISTGIIKLTLSSPTASVLIEEEGGDGSSLFVIMPITL